MIKLMVVDDEFFVRKGIIESIEWSKYDIEICGEASNGIEALSLLEHIHPDCILTDIKMGKMNGLEFIEHAQTIDKNIIFVILSGYDDFEDARKAISLGVSEYLLKPIGAEELINTMLKIKQKIYKANRLDSHQQTSLQNSVMLSWNMSGNTSLSLDCSFFRVFIFRVNNADHLSGQTALTNQKPSTNYISNIAEEYLILAGINHIVKSFDSNIFIVMLNYKNEINNFTNFLNCFIEYFYSKNNIEIIIGCGQEYTGYHNINQSYNQAFSALACHYHISGPQIIYSENIPKALLRNYMHNPLLQNFKFEIKIFSDLTQLTMKQYHSKLSLLFRKISNHNLTFEETKTLLLKICIMNLNRLKAPAQTIAHDLDLFNLLDIDTCNTFSDLKKQMETVYQQIQNFQKNETDNSYQNIIDLVMQYVYSHYNEDISLSLLSQKVHVTPNYLSKIFKDTVGENFKEWITQYRIAKSKELLLDPSLKVYEIGSLVGFNDYKHFASVFKKYVGCSAKEYRISMLKSKFL